MSREELIDLLEQGLDQGLTGDEWRRSLHALATRADAAEILAAVDGLAHAAADLRTAYDAAPVPAGLEAQILHALAGEAASRPRPPVAAGLLGALPSLMSAFRARSAEAARAVGQALSPGDLAAVAAARGPMAGPEPSLGAHRPEGAAATDREPAPEVGVHEGPSATPGAADAILTARVDDGVVHFGPGAGTQIVPEGIAPVAIDIGPLGPQAMGAWLLHLERGRVVGEDADHLVLSDDVEGLIVLPDGSMLAFGPVAEIRWN